MYLSINEIHCHWNYSILLLQSLTLHILNINLVAFKVGLNKSNYIPTAAIMYFQHFIYLRRYSQFSNYRRLHVYTQTISSHDPQEFEMHGKTNNGGEHLQQTKTLLCSHQ